MTISDLSGEIPVEERVDSSCREISWAREAIEVRGIR